MDQDLHGLIIEAKSQLDCFCALLSGMPDAPIEDVEPIHLLSLIAPVRERLEKALAVLESRSSPRIADEIASDRGMLMLDEVIQEMREGPKSAGPPTLPQDRPEKRSRWFARSSQRSPFPPNK
ncbi:hypothetical protein [Candidatus Endoriftia persephone]|uniref:Uncharacterized protein n=1 Tax=Candidatus Endoriftia persephonae TaxID=393765 RepID=A0A9J7A0V4_9GAMM|nr:hypothetical protein [Candidatus Endoriftia persephone]USF88779.1 hypothetical protein L0Y14_05975 [Candidatus Endoriftia persephone]